MRQNKLIFWLIKLFDYFQNICDDDDNHNDSGDDSNGDGDRGDGGAEMLVATTTKKTTATATATMVVAAKAVTSEEGGRGGTATRGRALTIDADGAKGERRRHRGKLMKKYALGLILLYFLRPPTRIRLSQA